MDFNGMRKKLILENKVTVVCVWLSICTALVILLGILLAVHIVEDDGSGDYVEVEYEYTIYGFATERNGGYNLHFTAERDGWLRIEVGEINMYTPVYLDMMYHKGENKIFLDFDTVFCPPGEVRFFERR